jgi:hypothetical protein
MYLELLKAIHGNLHGPSPERAVVNSLKSFDERGILHRNLT